MSRWREGRWNWASCLSLVGQSGCLCRGFVNGVARRLEEPASERNALAAQAKTLGAHLANSPLYNMCVCDRLGSIHSPYSEDRSSLDIHRRTPFPSLSSHAHNITGPGEVLHHFSNTCKSLPRRHDSTAFIT